MHCFLQLFSTGYERKKRGCLKTFETPSLPVVRRLSQKFRTSAATGLHSAATWTNIRHVGRERLYINCAFIYGESVLSQRWISQMIA